MRGRICDTYDTGPVEGIMTGVVLLADKSTLTEGDWSIRRDMRRGEKKDIRVRLVLQCHHQVERLGSHFESSGFLWHEVWNDILA